MWSVAAIATLAWGALSFGAVYPWGYWSLTVGAMTVGAIGLGIARGQIDGGPGRALTLTLVLMALATALECVPLSPDLLSRLSPAGDAFFGTRSVLGARQALSVDPRSTSLTVVWLLALAILFAGSARALRLVGVIPMARGIIALGVLLALVGIIGNSTSSAEMYGFWKPLYDTSPFAPFVNENHFAGWMLMALPVAIGYLCAGVATKMGGVRRDWRSRLLWFSTPAANELALVALGATLMAGSLVLTLSRSGIICFMVALLLLGWFGLGRQTLGMRRSLTLGYVTFVAVAAVGWAGVDAVAQEFAGSGVTMAGRLSAWGDALHIIRDFPLTGTGMNTYGTATLLYQADASMRFVHAENDYLQWAAEGGLLVGLPALTAVGLFLRDVRQRFRAGDDDPTTQWVRIGAITGVAAIALQELVDFSLQIPGNAVLFTLLCAVAAHRSVTRDTRVDTPHAGAARRAPGRPRLTWSADTSTPTVAR